MEKLDLKKELKHLYNPTKKKITTVDVPPLKFLMIDGAGSPGGEAYGEAVGALYSVAYTLKFAVKFAHELNFTVMPLEGLWWAEDMEAFAQTDKDQWLWTMLILVPDMVTAEMVEQAKQQATEKKEQPRIADVRLDTYHEGPSAQIMYIGPYAAEDETIAQIHQFITDQGHQLRGKHHEIYLSDPNRTAPERLKTVIRQPYG
jgi:hypothetical protein